MTEVEVPDSRLPIRLYEASCIVGAPINDQYQFPVGHSLSQQGINSLFQVPHPVVGGHHNGDPWEALASDISTEFSQQGTVDTRPESNTI